jgi:predicted dehydrogenase
VKPLRAAVVGLGRVGLLFDLDERRRGVWTHVGAYSRLSEEFDLVAVCDPDAERRALALARRPGLRAFDTLEDLLAEEPLDVVSICTPPEAHAQQVAAAAPYVRGIMCEKPLSSDAAEGEDAAAACAEAGVLLVVNYYKRFEAAVREAKRLLSDGAVGTLHSAVAIYSGGLDAVGSHAIDLVGFLVGELSLLCAAEDQSGTILRFGDGGSAHVIATSPAEDLVFEVDLLGSEGRIRILDNCARLELSRFEASERYGGYRELVPVPVAKLEPVDPFLASFLELAVALAGDGDGLRSDAAAALKTQRVLDLLRPHVSHR